MAQTHRYDRVAITLHWLIAVLILANLAIGLTFSPPLPGQFYSPKPLLPLHVSIGILVLLLSFARVGWRIAHRPPAYDHALPTWEYRLAKAAHWLFYVLIIAMPLTGWMTISAHKVHKTQLKLFGMPWPHFPGFTVLPVETISRLHDNLVTVHSLLAEWLLPAMLALHLGAIVKHHLIDRKPVLQRMLPGR
jgi:cytochrome b561